MGSKFIPYNDKKIRVVDFFSGCGGSSAGFRAAGMEILAGIDIDQDAAKTFKHNFPNSEFIREDIKKIKTNRLEKIIGEKRNFPLLFCACAPCQPFSSQNNKRHKGDERAPLLNQLHRFIRHYQPEFIFIENVPGIQKLHKGDGPFDKFIRLLDRLKYSYHFDVLNAEDYGVPQRRARLVLIASKFGEIKLPLPTHGKEAKSKHSTVWEWISYLPPIKAGETCSKIKNHQSASLTSINLKRIKLTPQGGDRRHWPEKLILKCHKKHAGHKDVYGRMKKNALAPSLTTRCTSISNGRFGHPVQDRAISIREAACIQTFPKGFVFLGGFNSMARQIGNAVPVLFANKIGRVIKKQVIELSRVS